MVWNVVSYNYRKAISIRINGMSSSSHSISSRFLDRTISARFHSRMEKLVTRLVKPVFLDVALMAEREAKADGDYKGARASLHKRPHAGKHATTES